MVLKNTLMNVSCPNCGENILKDENNESILRNRIVVFRETGAIAKCKQCGQEVKVPVRLEE